MTAVSLIIKPPRVAGLVLSAIVTSVTLMCPAQPARAEPEQGPDTKPRTLQAALPQADIDALRPDDLNAQWYDCGCYDQPVKHFPYSIVVFKNEAGDLVTRPERHEGALTFSPLAQRHGNRYCTLESKEECYGSFPHPCDFTDFRYGPYLAEFFPTCKSDEPDPD